MQQCVEVKIFSLFYGYNIVNYKRCKGIFKGNYSENLLKKNAKIVCSNWNEENAKKKNMLAALMVLITLLFANREMYAVIIIELKIKKHEKQII